MTQPALMTGSISSAIGMGGGTTGAPPAMGAGSTGRFTGGVRFSDPMLQSAFSDPLTAEDYAGFMLSAPQYGAVLGHDYGFGPGPWQAGMTYGAPVAPNAYDWERYFSPPTVRHPDTYEDLLLGGGDNTPKIYRGGAEVSDPATLNERERRAFQALRDPKSSNVFDAQSHSAYSRLRPSWYTSPFAMGHKYGFSPKHETLAGIEAQYKSSSPGYIPMDFFAKGISDKLATSNAATYGNIALATDVLDAWRQQPAMSGKFSGIDDFPSIWWGQPNSVARREERAYIAEELEEAAKDDGPFGGGFLGKLLSFAGPILSFTPLAPLGWALGAMNAVASGDPLRMILAAAGPIISSMDIPNFGGGDLGGGLVAPESFSFGDSLSSGWSSGPGLGLQAPANWGVGGFSQTALPGISLASGLTSAVPGFAASTLGSGLSIPPGAAEAFGTPAWSGSSNSLLGNKLVQQAAKGALKLGMKGLMNDGSDDRLGHLRAVQEKQKGQPPILQQPQAAMAPPTQASPEANRRWLRLKYGNDPMLAAGNILPQ